MNDKLRSIVLLEVVLLVEGGMGLGFVDAEFAD